VFLGDLDGSSSVSRRIATICSPNPPAAAVTILLDIARDGGRGMRAAIATSANAPLVRTDDKRQAAEHGGS